MKQIYIDVNAVSIANTRRLNKQAYPRFVDRIN